MDNAAVKALAKEAFQGARAKKSIQMKNEEVILTDGSVFHPMPVKSSSDLLRASMLILFKHVADIHLVVVQVIAEKFGLDINDIEKAITEDPRWTEMLINPVITDLTAAAQENSVPPPPPKKRGRPPKAAAKPVAVKKPEVVPEEEDLVFD